MGFAFRIIRLVFNVRASYEPGEEVYSTHLFGRLRDFGCTSLVFEEEPTFVL